MLCPKCGKEIDSFIYSAFEQIEATAILVDNRRLEYISWTSSGNIKDEEYACPECGEVLFKNEDDAIKFLRGG